MKLLRITLAAAAVAAAAVPLTARAESSITSLPSGTMTATARVNFSVVIPRFVFLQVGTGTLLAANGTIDSIAFTPAVAVVGNSTAVAATAASGNLGNGGVTVRVIGNVGNVTMSATAGPNLVSGSDNIPWTQIATAVTGGATHPTINGATAVYTATGNVVNVSGSWVYSYLNTVTPAAGTYTGQVLYTATTP
jgi:hypothetical protein